MGQFATASWDQDAEGNETCRELSKNLPKKSKKRGLKKQKTFDLKQQLKTKPDFVQNLKKQITKKLVKLDEPKDLRESPGTSKGKKNIKKSLSQQNLLQASEDKSKVTKKQKRKTKLLQEEKLKPLSIKTVKKLKSTQDNSKTLTPKIKTNGVNKAKKKTTLLKDKFEEDTNTIVKQAKTKVKKPKLSKKLQNLKNIITEAMQSEPKPPKKLQTLREKMITKLNAARFRFVNEQLYNSDSKNSQQYFAEEPEAFEQYHQGYRQQVKQWPLNPLDHIIKNLNKMSPSLVVADFGCGEARLAKSVKQKVHSFDLVALNDRVTACNMSQVPLENSKIDIAVFCLSLMGTNLQDYLLEANRVLKIGGTLKLAEIESRFDNIDEFIATVQKYGFQVLNKDLSHNFFYFLNFKKVQDVKKQKQLPIVTLQPCLYKKR